MSSAHSHRSNLDREAGRARVTGIQDEYRRELARRFRELRRVLRETIAENDALRLNVRDNAQPVTDFEFERNAGKQIAFNQQLNEWLEQGLLIPITEEEIRRGEHHTGVFPRSAYGEGVRYAHRLLRQAVKGDPADPEIQEIMGRPLHVSELETIYLRNYQGLQDITRDIDRSLSRILANALREGVGSEVAASRITKEVETIQHTRARALARTETLHAHNSASLRRYEEFNVGKVEILTHTPCPICARLEANDPYPISKAPMLPAHPNCVCTYGPVI